MESSSDSVASALRIVPFAQRRTLACACGKMAEGYAKPCKQPVCTDCVKDMCPKCKAPYTTPNVLCPKHRGPECPHKYCTNKGVVSSYQPEPRNGADLFKAVSEHGQQIKELLDRLVVLTKDT
ncbi:hypothetical protein EV122DRAFT_279821 [Schizophyllum commune]